MKRNTASVRGLKKHAKILIDPQKVVKFNEAWNNELSFLDVFV